MNKRFKTSYIYSILLLSSLIPADSLAKQEPETWLTVFVHGIMSIKPHLSASNFMHFIKDDVEDSVYSKTVELMRADKHFFQNQAMQEVGLKRINQLNVTPGNASGAMALVFDTMSSFVNKDITINNHYYTYGWSGLLSQKRRYIDAREFYLALANEVELYKKQGIDVKVRIIGYSHGGNVLLNLALVRQNEPTFPSLKVDELALLGMPVQSETDYLINDPIFGTIYHIYSRGDRIQKLDFFSTQRFFSARIFKARPGFILPDKLIQIQLKCTRDSRFAYKRPSLAYSFNNKTVIAGKSRYLRDASPGHSELWFFSWTPSNYRKNFPLKPLPAAALLPLIIREARNFEEKRWFEKPTLIDIRPEHELVIVKNQKSKKVLTISQFLPIPAQEQLGKMVMQFAPHNYTPERYSECIQMACGKAHDYYDDLMKAKQNLLDANSTTAKSNQPIQA